MSRPRHYRAAPRRGRADGGTQAGGGCQPGQVAVPGSHEPRDPHADERHPRHDGVDGRHRALARAAQLCPRHRALGAHAADADRRDPRFLQDRGRQAAAQLRTAGNRRVRAGRGGAAGPEGLREGHRHRLGRRPGPAVPAARRRGALAPDRHQPRRQCHQIYRQRRRSRDRRALAHEQAIYHRRRRGHRHRRRGHRHRHRVRGAAGAVLGIRAGRCGRAPSARRHRAGACHIAAAGAGDGRRDPRRQPARLRLDVYGDRAAEAGRPIGRRAARHRGAGRATACAVGLGFRYRASCTAPVAGRRRCPARGMRGRGRLGHGRSGHRGRRALYDPDRGWSPRLGASRSPAGRRQSWGVRQRPGRRRARYRGQGELCPIPRRRIRRLSRTPATSRGPY